MYDFEVSISSGERATSPKANGSFENEARPVSLILTAVPIATLPSASSVIEELTIVLLPENFGTTLLVPPGVSTMFVAPEGLPGVFPPMVPDAHEMKAGDAKTAIKRKIRLVNMHIPFCR
jgi:hypothetical protein